MARKKSARRKRKTLPRAPISRAPLTKKNARALARLRARLGSLGLDIFLNKYGDAGVLALEAETRKLRRKKIGAIKKRVLTKRERAARDLPFILRTEPERSRESHAPAPRIDHFSVGRVYSKRGAKPSGWWEVVKNGKTLKKFHGRAAAMRSRAAHINHRRAAAISEKFNLSYKESRSILADLRKEAARKKREILNQASFKKFDRETQKKIRRGLANSGDKSIRGWMEANDIQDT